MNNNEQGFAHREKSLLRAQMKSIRKKDIIGLKLQYFQLTGTT